MEPITVIAVGTGISFLVEQYRARKEKAQKAVARGPVAPPPEFAPEQVARFTQTLGPARHFKREFVEKCLTVLADYSAVPVDVAELREFGRVWSIVPKTPGAENAADLVRKLWQAPGCAVLGSLTLALPMHSPAQKLLFAGGLGVAAKCAPTTGGPFAVLTKPPPVTPVEAPKPEPPKAETPKVEVVERVEAEVLPAVLSTPEVPKNGASKKRYETPVVIDHPPIPKEPLA